MRERRLWNRGRNYKTKGIEFEGKKNKIKKEERENRWV